MKRNQMDGQQYFLNDDSIVFHFKSDFGNEKRKIVTNAPDKFYQ